MCNMRVIYAGLAGAHDVRLLFLMCNMTALLNALLL